MRSVATVQQHQNASAKKFARPAYLPMGVQLAEARAVAALECQHDRFTTYVRRGGGRIDDHVFEKGHCRDCGQWLAIETCANGDMNERPLTAAEIAECTGGRR